MADSLLLRLFEVFPLKGNNAAKISPSLSLSRSRTHSLSFWAELVFISVYVGGVCHNYYQVFLILSVLECRDLPKT